MARPRLVSSDCVIGSCSTRAICCQAGLLSAGGSPPHRRGRARPAAPRNRTIAGCRWPRRPGRIIAQARHRPQRGRMGRRRRQFQHCPGASCPVPAGRRAPSRHPARGDDAGGGRDLRQLAVQSLEAEGDSAGWPSSTIMAGRIAGDAEGARILHQHPAPAAARGGWTLFRRRASDAPPQVACLSARSRMPPRVVRCAPGTAG